MKPIQSLLFIVQKNKKNGGSTVLTLMDKTKISSLFDKNVNKTCVISGWYLSNTSATSPVSKTDDIAVRMVQ
jgi:hypothetical protein